jgi:hypothetical protein
MLAFFSVDGSCIEGKGVWWRGSEAPVAGDWSLTRFVRFSIGERACGMGGVDLQTLTRMVTICTSRFNTKIGHILTTQNVFVFV